jgi:GST-like protein
MIEFYTANTSNGQRAAIMLEECGLAYTVHRVDLMGGEQRTPAFLGINPGGTIPAIVDRDGPGGAPLALAQSGAILLYLAMKTGRFFPVDPARRAEAFQWLMHALTDTAAASMTIFVLTNYAPEKSAANVAHFEERVAKFLRDADGRLADREFLAGNEVSIADFALYPLTVVRRSLIERAGDLAHLTRWAATLASRPALQRGMRAAL